MKKGFTMIELIFVIVILGILASVAIPRLASTREDAEISAAIANIRTLLSDVSAYYVTTGKFATDFKTMSNVKIKVPENAQGQAAYGIFEFGGVECLSAGVQNTEFTQADGTVTHITNNPYIYFMPAGGSNAICDAVLNSDPVQKILNTKLAKDSLGGLCMEGGPAGCIEITSSSVYSNNENN